MKKLLLPTFLLLSSFCGNSLFAQKVTGKINLPDSKGAEFATISVMAAKDSTFQKGVIADADGAFEIDDLAMGKYFLNISTVGYVTMSSPAFDWANTDLALPTYELKALNTELKEVTVTYKKPPIEIQADKTILNVEGSINATGTTAMDLLRKAPGVKVDKDDNIAMKGKTGVQIYIDGKPTNMDNDQLASILKSMNSSEIEAIEMITNPSAKFDAAGNAGIINIRLKKNKSFGTNGTISVGTAYGQTAKYNGNLSVNHRNDKINFFSNVSTGMMPRDNDLVFNRVQSGVRYNQVSNMRDSNIYMNIKTGLDYTLDKKNSIGVVFKGNFSDNVFSNESRTPISRPNSEEIEQVLVATNRIPIKRNNLSYNLNYRYADTLGRSFGIDADYTTFRSEANSYQPNFYKTADESRILATRIFKNQTPIDIAIKTIKADWEQKAWGGTIGFGGKISDVKTDNNFRFFDVLSDGSDTMNLDRSNRFIYTERVSALYANYNRTLNKKWALQTGLRMENTHSIGDLVARVRKDEDYVERDYTNFFPSGALTYTMNDKNTFNLTYSKRINRPSYQDLNPFENKLDELAYEKGNAFLRPQYADNFELTHNFKNFINSSISYSHTKDFFTQTTDTTEGSRTFVTQKNLGSVDNYSFNTGLPLNFAKWWTGFTNITVFHARYKANFGEGRSFDVPVTGYEFYAENTITLPKEYSLQLSGFYSGPSVWGGTFKNKPLGGMDFGIQKKMWKGDGTVKFTFTDVLNTLRWRSESDFAGLQVTASGRWEARQVKLNFSYRFGNKNVQVKQKKGGNEQESNRIKGGK